MAGVRRRGTRRPLNSQSRSQDAKSSYPEEPRQESILGAHRADRIEWQLKGARFAWIIVVALAGAAAAVAPAAATDVTPFTVSLPNVTGPIPSTSTSFPYIADGFDVEPAVPAGYVEQEYFFSGKGNLYEYTATGIEVVTPCPTTVTEGTNCTGIPYTTRMLLKRPIDPRKFSGTVVTEAPNPSAYFDIAAIWDRSLNYFVRNGDVFVGWTSKSVTVNTLKTWNPTRYAPLN
jgi:Alpha/beta hydrolase domain